MKSSDVYLRAAKWLDTNPFHILAYACLWVAPNEDHGARCKHIKKWLGNEYIDGDNVITDDSVLALLFMRQIALDEEKS